MNSLIRTLPRAFANVTAFHKLEISTSSTQFRKEKKHVNEPIEDNTIPNQNKKGQLLRIQTFETSEKYMKSKEYEEAYRGEPVWKYYVRNFKGQLAPKTRVSCYNRQQLLRNNNPCPICRDEYLVVDYRNTQLLEQFVSVQTGELLPMRQTCLCREQQLNVECAIEKARDFGLMQRPLQHRIYDYRQFYSQHELEPLNQSQIFSRRVLLNVDEKTAAEQK